MFGFLKKKSKEEELEQTNKELNEVLKTLKERSLKLDQKIAEAEDILRSRGYTDDDFRRIRQKCKMKVMK